MTDITQWTVTANQALNVLGHVSRPGESTYMVGNSNRSERAVVVASLPVPGANWTVLNKKTYVITETQVKNYLTAQGEPIPPDAIMWVKVLTSGDRILMITPDTQLGRL